MKNGKFFLHKVKELIKSEGFRRRAAIWGEFAKKVVRLFTRIIRFMFNSLMVTSFLYLFSEKVVLLNRGSFIQPYSKQFIDFVNSFLSIWLNITLPITLCMLVIKLIYDTIHRCYGYGEKYETIIRIESCGVAKKVKDIREL